jgi:hypothetical protein
MYRCEIGSPGKRMRFSRDESSVLKEQSSNTKATIQSPITTRSREPKSVSPVDSTSGTKLTATPVNRRLSTRLQTTGSAGQSCSKVSSTQTPKTKIAKLSKTPKTARTPKAAKTPQSTRKASKEVKSATKAIGKTVKVNLNQHLFGEARRLLHPSAVPETLSCRTNEFCQILHFVKDALLEGVGGCMYIAGVPGTGKTATVLKVIRYLSSPENKQTDELPDFKFIEVNGLKLTDPQQFYPSVYQVMRFSPFFYLYKYLMI